MIEALAAIGSVGTVGLAVAVVVLAFKYVGAVKEQLAARDMLDKEREQKQVALGELATEAAAHAVTQKRLLAEQDLRASVESQRNDAYRRARDYYAARLKASGVADAIRIVDDLLSAPLPGVVREEEATVPAGDPNRTDDDLLPP